MDEIDFAALLVDAEESAWVIAGFDGGECATCGALIETDDEIRALGNGEWERRLCCG